LSAGLIRNPGVRFMIVVLAVLIVTFLLVQKSNQKKTAKIKLSRLPVGLAQAMAASSARHSRSPRLRGPARYFGAAPARGSHDRTRGFCAITLSPDRRESV
jgi:hypothetical protein